VVIKCAAGMCSCMSILLLRFSGYHNFGLYINLELTPAFCTQELIAAQCVIVTLFKTNNMEKKFSEIY